MGGRRMEFSPPTGNESMPEIYTGWRRKLHPAAIRQTNRKSEKARCLDFIAMRERLMVCVVLSGVETNGMPKCPVVDRTIGELRRTERKNWDACQVVEV